MNCPYCGIELNNDQSFCPKCGNRVINHTPSFEYQISDNKELESFIDDNAKIILSKKFSLPCLFLGPLYGFYRKMYLLSTLTLLLQLLVLVVSYFILNDIIYIGIIGGSLILIINLVIALKFNSIYISSANKKIYHIKNRNNKLTNYDKMEKIKYSGGVNLIIPVLVFGLLVFLIFKFYNYNFVNTTDELSNHNYKIITLNNESTATLSLNSDKSFMWYFNNIDKNKNYYIGNYKVYNGKMAIKKAKEININTNFIKNISDYYILILNVERTNTEGRVNNQSIKYIYHGLYNKIEKAIDLVGINHMNHMNYIKLEKQK